MISIRYFNGFYSISARVYRACNLSRGFVRVTRGWNFLHGVDCVDCGLWLWVDVGRCLWDSDEVVGFWGTRFQSKGWEILG